MTVRTAWEEERYEDLLRQEVEALAQLKHPNILLLMGLLKANFPQQTAFKLLMVVLDPDPFCFRLLDPDLAFLNKEIVPK